jgi:hypothetical protein
METERKLTSTMATLVVTCNLSIHYGSSIVTTVPGITVEWKTTKIEPKK